MFVDEARIEVRGGSGGGGAVSFRREKYVPRGGPDGGDGGHGGSVYLIADPQLATLVEFRHKRRFAAGDGQSGGSDNCAGAGGADVPVPVPCGTLVYDGDELVADLRESGQRAVVARGGRGGLGNQHFATATRQAPKFSQAGELGQRRTLRLQLKLLADAGIVGAPNAGKSTLLAAVSAARPKIADYPFTTLEPQLGVVRVDVDASFVLVDVPGLIEGASLGAGLGDAFLRHIERTAVLVHLVDGALEPSGAVAQLGMIEAELRAWNPALLEKRRIVAVTKQDLPTAAATLAAVREAVGAADSSREVLGISAATGHGVRALVTALYKDILEARAQAAQTQPEVVLHPRPTRVGPIKVEREGRAFRVHSARLERLAAVTDFESDEAREFFERALARSGAMRRLERLGVRPGDKVRVGAFEFRL